MNLEKLEQLIEEIENLGISYDLRTGHWPKKARKIYILDLIKFELATTESCVPEEETVFFAFSNSTTLFLKFNHSMFENNHITEQEASDLERLLQTVKITYTRGDEQKPFAFKIIDTEGLILSEVSNKGKLLELLQKGTELSFTFNDSLSNFKMAEQILIRFIVDYLTKNKAKEKILSHIKEIFF